MIKLEQKGFTIVELLISIGILGIIAPLLALALFQILTFTERGRAGFEAQADTRNAAGWMSQDIVMAQETDLIVPEDILDPFKEINNPICGKDVVGFIWIDKFKDRNNVHEVTYCLRNDDPPDQECPPLSPCLVRSFTVGEAVVAGVIIDSDGNPASAVSKVIARHIMSVKFEATELAPQREISITIRSKPAKNRFGVDDEKTFKVLMRPTYDLG